MFSIAHSELTQILRNRSVLITSLIMPLASAAFFIYYRDVFAEIGSLGYVAALLVVIVGAFSLFTTAVTTLASRRQTLFLKRLRSTAASDASILGGLVLPVLLIAIVQVSVLLAVFGIVGEAPGSAAVLALAIVSTFVMLLALALATAGVTNSPEHAQVTTLPVSLGVLAVATWVGITGTESMMLLKRALPGGAATELVTEAWNGPIAWSDSLVLLAPTLGWVVVAIALASSMFRWEPRR